jgi:uncharacterized damage-inducible protein DinB
MHPLHTYDYLMLARQRVFDWVRPVSLEDYARKLPTWNKTLGQTLTHILASEWYYIQRLEGHEVPPYDTWRIREEEPLPFPALESAWAEQARATRDALAAVRDWNAALEYRVTGDDGVRSIVTASPADIFTQLVLHEVHHRSQAMNMLQRFGAVIDDIDFNSMMYRRRPVDSQG